MAKKQIPVSKDQVVDAMKQQRDAEVKEFLELYKEFSKDKKFDFGVQLNATLDGIFPRLVLVEKKPEIPVAKQPE